MYLLGLVVALIACSDETTRTNTSGSGGQAGGGGEGGGGGVAPIPCSELCTDSDNPSDDCLAQCKATALSLKMCDCYGCSDDEKEQCIDENTNLENYAYKEGCREMVTEFFDCMLNKFHCNDTKITFGDCSDDEMRLKNCIKDDVHILIPGEPEGSSSSSSAAASSGAGGAG